MLVRSFLCNVNNMQALIGLCLLVMLHWGQIRDLTGKAMQVFTIAHIVIGLLLHYPFFYSSKDQRSISLRIASKSCVICWELSFINCI